LLLIYFSERHSPFLLRANSLAIEILSLVSEQVGHHVLPFFILLNEANHSCPFMHFQYIGVILLTYSLERHFPPRDSAIFIASLKDNFFDIAINKICFLNNYPTFQYTMEYYELCKLDETIPSKKQNPFAPKHPFRLLV